MRVVAVGMLPQSGVCAGAIHPRQSATIAYSYRHTASGQPVLVLVLVLPASAGAGVAWKIIASTVLGRRRACQAVPEVMPREMPSLSSGE